MRGSRKPKTFKVDIQRELLLTGCAIEETKRKARQREQHIKDLLARVQKSHEEKKKRNIGLHNRQNQQSSVKASLFEFPDSEGAEGAELRTLAPSRSSSRVDIRGVYTPKKPSSRCPSVQPPPRGCTCLCFSSTDVVPLSLRLAHLASLPKKGARFFTNSTYNRPRRGRDYGEDERERAQAKRPQSSHPHPGWGAASRPASSTRRTTGRGGEKARPMSAK